MKIQTRRAAAVTGIAILVGAAGSGTMSAQGDAQQQQVTNEVVIPISAISRDHQDRGEHRSTRRANWSERNGSSHSWTGKGRTAQNGTAGVGVEAAAATDVWGQAAGQSSNSAGLEVVLKSLPGISSTGADSNSVDPASRDATGEACS